MELESTLYIVIQLVEIYDGGIEPGKARIYDSQHCSDKCNRFQWWFLCFRSWLVEKWTWPYELPLTRMGNLVHLEWRRRKLELVISHRPIVIFSQFQRGCLCFQGRPLERRHWRYELPLADMNNLVHLEWRRWKLELVIPHWPTVIFSQLFQRGFLCFHGRPLEWRHWRYELPLADMSNLVHLEWRRWKMELVWYLTGGLRYFYNSKGVSYVFRAPQLNGDTDATNFHW